MPGWVREVATVRRVSLTSIVEMKAMGMIVISIDRYPSQDQYGLQRKRWAEAQNSEIRLPSNVLPDEAYRWIDFLLKRIGDGFADSLLSSFVELDSVVDEQVLCQVLTLADKSARVSVCLKAGLGERLRNMCLSDDDDDVREHFKMRYDACESHPDKHPSE